MYTIEQREEVFNWLTAYIKTCKEVVSLIQVGSGATGYKDVYSDIDLVLAVQDKTVIEAVNDDLLSFIQKTYTQTQVKVYHHHEEVVVSCLFLDHYLELDLGIWTLNMLKATKPNFKILYDDIGLVHQKLTIAPSIQAFATVVDHQMSTLWQFVNNVFVAIKRTQYVLAFNELLIIKNYIMSLICLQEGINHDDSKHFDQLINQNAQALKTLYVCELTEVKLVENLHAVIDLYFTLIDQNRYEDVILFIKKFLQNEMVKESYE